MWYIPEGYSTRTEFKVLSQLVAITPVNLLDIPDGILVLPGILLLRIDKSEIDNIKVWIRNRSNHLILAPTWSEVDLKQVFGLSSELEIVRNDGIVNTDIPIDYTIQTKSKKVLIIDGKLVGAHYRDNTGTGLITIVTAPLFDYRLKNVELRHSWWSWVITEIDQKIETKIEAKIGEAWEPNPLQKMIYLLIHSEIPVNKDLPKLLKNYFGIRITDYEAESELSDLVRREIIHKGQISELGATLFARYNFKSFTKVLQARKKENDEWNFQK